VSTSINNREVEICKIVIFRIKIFDIIKLLFIIVVSYIFGIRRVIKRQDRILIVVIAKDFYDYCCYFLLLDISKRRSKKLILVVDYF